MQIEIPDHLIEEAKGKIRSNYDGVANSDPNSDSFLVDTAFSSATNQQAAIALILALDILGSEYGEPVVHTLEVEYQ